MANEKTMNSRIQHKHDITANWNKAVNFIPKAGEIIVYDDGMGNGRPAVKIGDGERTVGQLQFIDDYKNITEDFLAQEETGYGDTNEYFVSLTEVGKYFIEFEGYFGYCEIHNILDCLYHTITQYSDDGFKTIFEYCRGELTSTVEHQDSGEYHYNLKVYNIAESEYAVVNKKYVDDKTFKDITEDYLAQRENGYDGTSSYFLSLTEPGKYYILTVTDSAYCEINNVYDMIYHTITNYSDDGFKDIYEYIDGDLASYIEHDKYNGANYVNLKVSVVPNHDDAVVNKKYVDESVKNNGVGRKTSQGGEIFNDYSDNQATAEHSHAEGFDCHAFKRASHAEGDTTTADGMASHAEGDSTTAEGNASHAEGYSTNAYGDYSHAEGNYTEANGDNSHAEGFETVADGDASHAEGQETHAVGNASHTEGMETMANGFTAHAEGYSTIADGQASHVSGYNTVAIGDYTTATGKSNEVGIYGFKLLSIDPNDDYTEFEIEIDLPDDEEHVVPYTNNDLLSVDCSNHVYDQLKIIEQVPSSVRKVTYRCCTVDGQPITNFKVDTKEDGSYNDDPWENWVYCLSKPHPEHSTQVLSGEGAYAGGVENRVVGRGAFAHGRELQAIGDYAHAEGRNNYAGYSSHVEGKSNKATGGHSHAEGHSTVASGPESHAEGYSTIASGKTSHVEGYANNAFADYSHVEGWWNTAEEDAKAAHVEGFNNIAAYPYQHVSGKFNQPVNYAFVVGNGSPAAVIAGGEESHNLVKENDWQGVNNSGITKYIDTRGIEWFDFNSTGNALGIKQTFEGKKGAIYTLQFLVDGVNTTIGMIPSGVYIGLWFFKDSAINDNWVSTQLAELGDGRLQCQMPDDANIVEIQIGNNSGTVAHYRFADISLTEKVGLIYTQEFQSINHLSDWEIHKGQGHSQAIGIYGPYYNNTNSLFFQVNDDSYINTPKFNAIPGTKYLATMMTYRVSNTSRGNAEFIFLNNNGERINQEYKQVIANYQYINWWQEETIADIAPEGAVKWYIQFRRDGGDYGLDHLMIFDGSITASYENRSNAFMVDWNGDTKLAGKLYASNIPIEDTDNPGCFYYMRNGEREWINPPMKIGQEYKTIERRWGKPVYTKLVYLGSIPLKGRAKSVALIDNDYIGSPLRVEGFLEAPASPEWHTLPVFGIECGLSRFISENDYSSYGLEAWIKSTQDSGLEERCTAYINTWYTKE